MANIKIILGIAVIIAAIPVASLACGGGNGGTQCTCSGNSCNVGSYDSEVDKKDEQLPKDDGSTANDVQNNDSKTTDTPSKGLLQDSK